MVNEQLESENEMLHQFLQGCPSAFSTIFRVYFTQLLHYAHKNIHRKEDCEEIVQDVFVSLWERRESLEIVNLRTYLFKAVRYKIIRYFQHQKVRNKYAEHYRLFEAIYHVAKDDAPYPTDLGAVLEKHISALPERCQNAFRLRLYENLSNPEIAQRMNITRKTVEVYMFRAFSHLRSCYGEIWLVNQ